VNVNQQVYEEQHEQQATAATSLKLDCSNKTELVDGLNRDVQLSGLLTDIPRGDAAAEEKDNTTAENQNDIDMVASPCEVIQLKKF